MSNHKRKIAPALCLVCLAGIALSPASHGAPKKLRFWVPAEYAWKLLVSEYEKANRGVDVEIVTGDRDKFYTMITAGLMPDVWGPWGTAGITADVNRNWAVDLTAYMKRDSKELNIDDFYPGLMRQFKVKGKQYSLPMLYYVDWYYYDRDKYANAGLMPPPVDPADKSWTWDTMVLNAQKITKYGSNRQVQQPGLEWWRWLGTWALMWGARPYSEEAIRSSIPQEIYLDTPEFTNALTKVWELIYKYNVAKPAQMNFVGNAGQVGSSIEPGWNIKYLMGAKKPRWALAPLPYAKTNSGTTWPDGWRISRVSKNKELAWDFVKFLCSPSSMRMVLEDPKSTHRGSGVARKSVFRETMARDIATASGMSAGDVSRIFDGADDVGVPKYHETICLNEDLWNTYLDATLVSVYSGKVSPKQCAVQLQERANKGMPILFQRWLRNIKFSGADGGK